MQRIANWLALTTLLAGVTDHALQSRKSWACSMLWRKVESDPQPKKWENHELMFAFFAAWYNFRRPHMTLMATPVVAAGLAGRSVDGGAAAEGIGKDGGGVRTDDGWRTERKQTTSETTCRAQHGIRRRDRAAPARWR
jgi:hypothetical protein